jgi:hypothetical protein
MKRASCILLIVTFWAAARPSLANDSGNKDAEALFKEGVAFVDRAKVDGDPAKYDAARRKFSASYALAHRASVLFSLALAEEKLHRTWEALHHFRQFLREPDAQATWLEPARSHIERLSVLVASFDVQAPPGAEIYVDDAPTGTVAPLADPVDLPEGLHILEARLGDKRVVRPVDATAGTRTTVTLDLTEATSAPSPPRPVPAPSVAVAAAPTLPRFEESPRHGSNARSVMLFVLGGAAVVATGVGVGFAVAAATAADRQTTAQAGYAPYRCSGLSIAACRSLDDAAKTKANDGTVAAVSFATAGGLALGFVATVLLWPSASSTPVVRGGLRVAPSVGSSHAAVTLAGVF